MELQLPTDTGNQLISFNVAALQSMMQAVAREVAEKVGQLLNFIMKTAAEAGV